MVDVASQAMAQVLRRIKPPSTEEFCFQGVEERFHRGVVGGLSRSVHAGDNPMRVQQVTEEEASVLDAPVGVEDESGRWAPPCDGGLHGAPRQIDRPAVAECPADHLARIQIQDDGEILPFTLHRQIRDVAGPLLVRPLWAAGTLEMIRRPCAEPMQPGLAARDPYDSTPKAIRLH